MNAPAPEERLSAACRSEQCQTSTGWAYRGTAGRAWLGAALLLIGLFALLSLLERTIGAEPPSAWICDDTRFTRLVPRGREVVGPPVAPVPGCRP